MTCEQPNVTLNGRYSVREAAAIMGTSVRAIYKWIEGGLLMASVRRTNGRMFIYGRELIRFWER